MTDNYLKSWLDRVENLEEEQKDIGSDKRDLYAEAKSKGYNPKALRRIVAARKRKDEDEIESDVAVYKAALGLAVDLVRNDKLSLREASRKTGASKSSIHRALAVPAASQPIITETARAVAPGEVERDGGVTTAQPDDLANESCGGTLSDRASETLEATVSEGSAVLTADDAGTARTGSLAPSLTDVASRCEPGPQDPIDDLAIPPFLDRRAQVRA